ncbi:MAG TPA: gliding motility-associated peptidyl-prolyl isomerase GldI [Salinimicrobium sp.]|nr:gliding motility-associated peptidyl-prolyl isomerase GldI [Salinimicrobium sp.]
MKNLSFIIILVLTVFSCKSPEARRPVSQKSGTFIQESVERNKKIVAAEEKAILEIIEKDSANTYISSPNGFWYYYNEKDTTSTKKPVFGDVVEFEYNLRTLNGRQIYTDEEIPRRTYIMDQEEIFTGLREGLKLMREGETVTFLFPSHKAFGYYGDKKRIGTNIPVISTVTLYSIKSKENNQNQN